MNYITISAIPHPSAARSTGFIYRNDSKVNINSADFKTKVVLEALKERRRRHKFAGSMASLLIC